MCRLPYTSSRSRSQEELICSGRWTLKSIFQPHKLCKNFCPTGFGVASSKFRLFWLRMGQYNIELKTWKVINNHFFGGLLLILFVKLTPSLPCHSLWLSNSQLQFYLNGFIPITRTFRRTLAWLGLATPPPGPLDYGLPQQFVVSHNSNNNFYQWMADGGGSDSFACSGPVRMTCRRLAIRYQFNFAKMGQRQGQEGGRHRNRYAHWSWKPPPQKMSTFIDHLTVA